MTIDSLQDAAEFVQAWREDSRSPKRRAWYFRSAAQDQRANALLVLCHSPTLATKYMKIAAYLEKAAEKEERSA